MRLKVRFNTAFESCVECKDTNKVRDFFYNFYHHFSLFGDQYGNFSKVVSSAV